MARLSLRQARRRGAVVPLTAVFLIVMMALTALAVDLGYVIVVKTQLQNGADSAALAGAWKLLDNSLLPGTPVWSTVTPTIMVKARAEAQKFGVANSAGNVTLSIPDNTTNSPTGDIVCGWMSGRYNPGETMRFDKYPYNSVQVRVRRDNVANGSLSLFFARALGVQAYEMRGAATATCQMDITGFKIDWPGTTTCKLLPFTLHIDTWNSVLAGNGPDTFAVGSNGSISAGSDGIKECKLYPLSNGNGSGIAEGGSALPPGNFGTVDIGSPDNSTSVIARQILYGPNEGDLAYYANETLQLDTSLSPPSMIMEGDTGVSAGVKDELTSIVGQARIIPLYNQVTGNGENAQYTIVGFAGVRVLEVVLTGSLANKHLTIQPAFVIDGNAVSGGSNATTSWYVSRPVTLSR